MVAADPAGRLDEARTALDGVQDQPARSLAAAQAVLASDGCPAEAAVVARWAVGRALQELGEPARAVEALAGAARAAEASGDIETSAHIDMSRAWASMAAGDSTGALAALDRADAVLSGGPGARVQMQRGLISFQLGHLDAAMAAFDGALPALRRDHDDVAVARLLVNRSAVATAMGRWSTARSDLVEAAQVARAEGLGLVTAGAEHNLGFLCGRQGDVPRALSHFSRAADAYVALGSPARLMSVLAVDRCEVLLEAGLAREALDQAAVAVDGFAQTGAAADADEARLLLARAHLACGDPDAAHDTALAAEEGFATGGRHAWVTLAAYTALVAEVSAAEQDAEPPEGLTDRLSEVVRRLEAAGWTTEAAHARTLLGRAALASGRVDLVRSALEGQRIPPKASASLRVQVWHGRALLCSAVGDAAGATGAVRRGLHVVDAHRHSLGATELRAGASVLGSELARLGTHLALETGRPSRVLAAAERHRAATLRSPPARPSGDTTVGAALADLRSAEAERRAALGAGEATAALGRSIAAAELRVRDATRQEAGGATALFRPPSLTSLRSALGDRTLVEYVADGRGIHAVVVEPRRHRLVDLGDAATAASERDHLMSTLRRGLHSLLRNDGDSSLLDGRQGSRFLDSIAYSTRALSDLLVEPLGLASPEDPSRAPDVVIVPTSFGHSLPWTSLPGLSGRGVTVAPSAALWLRTRPGASDRERGTLLVSGPDLEGATAELDAIAELWPHARRLDGAAATVDAVLEAFGSAQLVHVAAHGSFRADSPLFSTLRLADGTLTVYDVEGLERVPNTVVLPACSAAAVDVGAGDELLGTTAALLHVGVNTVVAPIVAIPDHASATYTVSLHRRLRAGMTVARAAAEAADEVRSAGNPLEVLAATSFICVGADDGGGGGGGAGGGSSQ